MTTFVQGHGAGANQLPAALGQLVSAASLSVVIASDYTLPVTVTTAANNPLWVEFTDGTTGYVGAKTGQLPSALGSQVKASSLSVTLASDQGNLPVSIQNATIAVTQSGTWTIDGIPTTLGQKTMAGSSSVVIASDQSSLPVTVGNASLAVTGTFWQATQPVSAASLPLPTGAATSAKQPALGTAGAASADVLTVQGAASMVALKVDGSAVTQPVSGTFWQATQPVSAASLPLPTGAASSSNQTTANTSLAAIATSVSGTLATKDVGRTNAWLAFYDYAASGTVTTSAFTAIVGSTGAAASKLKIFDSSGSALIIATGGSGSEVAQLYVPPGGSDAPYDIAIASGTRISIKALDASATSGALIITALS